MFDTLTHMLPFSPFLSLGSITFVAPEFFMTPANANQPTTTQTKQNFSRDKSSQFRMAMHEYLKDWNWWFIRQTVDSGENKFNVNKLVPFEGIIIVSAF